MSSDDVVLRVILILRLVRRKKNFVLATKLNIVEAMDLLCFFILRPYHDARKKHAK